MRYEYMPIQAIKYVSKRTGKMSVGQFGLRFLIVTDVPYFP